jgi:hypothetical protein
MQKTSFLIAAALAAWLATGQANAGQIFITGHDPDWHAQLGANPAGSRHLLRTAIEFARAGSTKPFLYVESISTPVPVENAHTAPFLISAAGYSASDFVVADAAALNALADFRAALDAYSAVVVASDHGGMLTAAELSFLNAHRAAIADYVNAGGGLAAFSESNFEGLIGSETRFGFVPLAVSSASLQAPEVGNTVTAFGAALGLLNSDVNGNVAHSYFTSTGGLAPVDLLGGDPARPLTLASVRQGGGPAGAPEPSGVALLGLGALCLAGHRLRRKNPAP